MPNPFRYGKVVSGAYFTDRSTELATIETDILNGQDIVIISPRRYGKTSLIREAAERLRKKNVLVSYIDLFRSPSKEKFAEHLAGAIYQGLVPSHDRLKHQAAEFFEKLPIRPKVVLKPDGSYSFEFDVSSVTRDIDRTLEGLLEMPGKIASDRKRRVALVIDEFQEIVAIDPALPGVIRSVFQTQDEVAHVFLGNKRHLMQNMFTQKNQALYRMAKAVPLSEIKKADFTEFIRSRFQATGQSIEPEAIARIVEITSCHPHDTQELCYFVWSLAASEDLVVTTEVVERALELALEAENARCKELWDRLSPHKRRVLLALATGSGTGILSEEYRMRHSLGAASTVQKSVKSLVEGDIVSASPKGAYSIADVFLRAWLASFTDG